MKIVAFKKIIGYFNFHTDEGREIKVLRDWRIVLCGFVFILIIVFLLNGYIFRKYQGGLPAQAGLSEEIKISQEKIITIDRIGLQKVSEEINRKESQFNENLAPPKIKDPSL